MDSQLKMVKINIDNYSIVKKNSNKIPNSLGDLKLPDGIPMKIRNIFRIEAKKAYILEMDKILESVPPYKKLSLKSLNKEGGGMAQSLSITNLGNNL